MKKTKSKFWTSIFSIVVVVIIGVILFVSHTVVFTQAQAQSLVDVGVSKRGNLTGGVLQYRYDVTVSDVVLDIQDENLAIVTGHISGVVVDHLVSADFEVVGKPDIRGLDFYFLPSEKSKITNFRMEDKPIEKKGFIEKGKDLLGKVTGKNEDTSPESLREKAFKNLAGKAVDMVVEKTGLTGEELLILAKDEVRKYAPRVVKNIFADMSLYSLKNAGVKGLALGAMLHSVDVGNGEIAATFSVGLLLVKVLVILLMTIAMLGALLAFPGFAMLGIAFGG